MNDTISTIDPQVDSAVVAEQPVSQFVPDGTAGHNPVVTLRDDGREVVVVRRCDAVTVEISHRGELASCPAHTTAGAVTDPARQVEPLRQALTALTRERSRAADDLEVAESAARHARQEHDRALDEIREYAIDAHRDNTICRDGLNEFLRRFGMPEYCPRVGVRYTISGEVEIDRDDAGGAQRDLEDNLSLDLSQVDGVVAGTSQFQVEITDVDELD